MMVRLLVGLAGAVLTPFHGLIAQTFDSTGMPSLELLATEAGRASRIHAIRAVEQALLCDRSHPLVDSASLAACAMLTPIRAAAITQAFARGLEVPLGATSAEDGAVALPACPKDLDHEERPRVLVARITAPVVGVYEGRWEGRLLVELRCRSPGGTDDGVKILGKEYLYQWSGRAWEMYQRSWLRAAR